MAIGQSLADGRVRVLLIGFGKLNLELNGRYRSVGFGSGVGGVTSWRQHVTFGVPIFGTLLSGVRVNSGL